MLYICITIKNIKIMATFSNMTGKQKVEYYIKEMIHRRIYPYNLGMRAKRGLSSATAYQTKQAVNIVKDMSQDDIDYFLNNEKYKPFMQSFLGFAQDIKKKEMNKNIDKSDKYSEIISEIKKMIDPIIVEQQEKIKKNIVNSWKRINKEYEEIGEDGMKEKYGRKVYRRDGTIAYVSMSDFLHSFIGTLWKKPEKYLHYEIESQQKSYKDKEYAKVNKLISNLAQRYPDIDNIKLVDTNRSVNGIEFTMTATMGDKNLVIETSTIYAGGYNIQRLHLRWLMHVIDTGTGKTLSSFKGV